MTYFAPNFAPPTGQTPALETMAGGGPRDKLVQLERIERDIASSLQSAGTETTLTSKRNSRYIFLIDRCLCLGICALL